MELGNKVSLDYGKANVRSTVIKSNWSMVKLDSDQIRIRSDLEPGSLNLKDARLTGFKLIPDWGSDLE
jgi:hypothetical protein